MTRVVFAIVLRTFGLPATLRLMFQWVLFKTILRVTADAITGIPRAIFYVHRSPPCCYRACTAPWGVALWVHREPSSRTTYWTIRQPGRATVWRRIGDEP